MAHTDRDRRGRTKSGKRCPESINGGCVYCHTGTHKRAERRNLRRQKKTDIREQLA
ncbi:MAG TPA: hypothetical protein VFU07_05165 [Candidatus Lumbricidophila sp.]|nr:hypothetical protein [Candidatus Lumbricidophila sp.]